MVHNIVFQDSIRYMAKIIAYLDIFGKVPFYGFYVFVVEKHYQDKINHFSFLYNSFYSTVSIVVT